jgi:PEGA domain
MRLQAIVSGGKAKPPVYDAWPTALLFDSAPAGGCLVQVREVAAIAANGVIVLVLSGCSSATAPSWVPGWMTIKPEPQALRFESAPPGADVTVNVESNQSPQTCKTPCSLTLPLSKQSVTVALNGYEPQTLAVDVRDAKDFDPNPVQVTLQAVHPKSHSPKSAKTAPSSGEH